MYIFKILLSKTPEIIFLWILQIVTDSLKEISEKQKDLKKKLKVSFVGEPGLDMGGLTKEWFQLLGTIKIKILGITNFGHKL